MERVHYTKIYFNDNTLFILLRMYKLLDFYLYQNSVFAPNMTLVYATMISIKIYHFKICAYVYA